MDTLQKYVSGANKIRAAGPLFGCCVGASSFGEDNNKRWAAVLDEARAKVKGKGVKVELYK